MNILYFSPITWGAIKQRPQHIAEELSKYHKVYFIEPSLSFLSFKTKEKQREYEINSNLIVVQLGSMFRLPKNLECFDFLKINTLHERIKLKKIASKCEIIWLGTPIYYPIFKGENIKFIYDKMDDYIYLTTNKLMKKTLSNNEKVVIKKASIIFTTCKLFYEQIKVKNENTFLVNNGVNIAFNKGILENNQNRIVDDMEKLKNDGNIIFGYVGTIDHWFDFDAIKTILDFNNNYHVVIVGPNNLKEFKHQRVHYYSLVPKKDIPSIINGFDYCLYTFKVDEFIDTIDPVKIYEYLSLNKIVIAAKSKETERFVDYVTLYKSKNDLYEILNTKYLLKKPFSKEGLNIFIENNSWESRTKFMLEVIKSYGRKFKN